MTDFDVSAGSPAEHDGDNEFDPNTFMRARRLELYSDSEPLKRPLLSKELLEYQLDTLTSRKQEIEFEYFCRRLAEKEICPNLRPQTGPTGGGDSKVDSETVPVSSEISRIWVGFALEASKERWAFAFSAKKDWKGKARSDVASAIGTARGYKRLYFITNQFARDKARASLEDELRKRYGIDIYILDRSWILQCIFEHDRLTLAVEALRLTDLSFLTERKLGRRDAERQLDLDELEAEIADPTRYRGAQYQLAEDCFRAALLARALDKPRVEVDGYFARAERIAEEVGHPQQLLRLVYERAWTAFWWFNDVVEVNHLYDIVESKATGSLQAEDFELVVNLWQVLRASTVRGPIDAQTAKYEQRTIRLKTELDRLASDAARPNNALQARTDRLLLDLNEAITAGDHDKLNAVWDGFDKVVTDAESLGDYPFERFYKLVQAFGEIFPASGRFDQFFENVVRALEGRRSEGESGVALLGRGFQKLKGDKPYDAIRLFGRAQERLFRREYREELVSSLAGAAQAYGHVGLFWAARSCALAAVERCLAFYREDGTIVRPVLPCLDLLAWQELRLGRLPRFMEVHETTTVIAPHLKLDEDRTRKLGEEMELQDLVCGLLLLKSSLRQLDMMRCLPHVLERVQLLHSRMALLYALGCQDTLQVEGYIPEGETAKSIELFFQQWLKQPANAELPNHPNLMNDEQVEFRSNLLGCDIVFAVENDGQCIYLAEALLGALEAFLATGSDLHVAPFRERARIIVKSSRSLHGSPEISVASQEGESS